MPDVKTWEAGSLSPCGRSKARVYKECSGSSYRRAESVQSYQASRVHDFRHQNLWINNYSLKAPNAGVIPTCVCVVTWFSILLKRRKKKEDEELACGHFYLDSVLLPRPVTPGDLMLLECSSEFGAVSHNILHPYYLVSRLLAGLATYHLVGINGVHLHQSDNILMKHHNYIL